MGNTGVGGRPAIGKKRKQYAAVERRSRVPKVLDDFPAAFSGRPGPALRFFRHNVAGRRALRGCVGAFLSSTRIVAFNLDRPAAQVYSTLKITPQSRRRYVISSHRNSYLRGVRS